MLTGSFIPATSKTYHDVAGLSTNKKLTTLMPCVQNIVKPSKQNLPSLTLFHGGCRDGAIFPSTLRSHAPCSQQLINSQEWWWWMTFIASSWGAGVRALARWEVHKTNNLVLASYSYQMQCHIKNLPQKKKEETLLLGTNCLIKNDATMLLMHLHLCILTPRTSKWLACQVWNSQTQL